MIIREGYRAVVVTMAAQERVTDGMLLLVGSFGIDRAMAAEDGHTVHVTRVEGNGEVPAADLQIVQGAATIAALRAELAAVRAKLAAS